jgi:hypothetical protein
MHAHFCPSRLCHAQEGGRGVHFFPPAAVSTLLRSVFLARQPLPCHPVPPRHTLSHRKQRWQCSSGAVQHVQNTSQRRPSAKMQPLIFLYKSRCGAHALPFLFVSVINTHSMASGRDSTGVPRPQRGCRGGGGLAATVLLSVLNPAVLCPACSFGSASRCFGRHDGQRTRSGRRCGRGGEQALLGETRWHHFQPPTPPLFSFSSPLDVGPCANRSEPSRSSYGLHLPEVCIGWTSTRPGLARVSKPCSR